MAREQTSTKHVSIASLLGALAFVVQAGALAQAYPSRPIRVVVPNPAGGIDVYMRVMLPKMVEFLGQQVLIENRAGASGAIGAENIARSAPDGYSLLFATSAVLVTSPFLNKNLPYDPVKSFTPVSRVLEPIELIVVNASLPVNSVKELIDLAKRNPGKLSYGSSGVGTIPHFDGELFKAAAGVDLLHVPYKGIAQILPELVGGRIDVAFPGVTSAAAHIASGKVRVLAVLDAKRYERMPDVPSIVDTLPGFRQAPIWFGLFGPSGLPRPVVERLHAAIVKALEAPEVRAKYQATGMRMVGSTPDDLAASMKADTELIAKLVKLVGIKPE